MALRFAGPIALVCALLTWLLNWGRNPIPFVGDMAGFGVLIFFFTIVIGFGVGAVGFVIGVRYRNWLVEPDQLEPRSVPASWMTTLLVNQKERCSSDRVRMTWWLRLKARRLFRTTLSRP